jgi:hypothetical protein
MSESVGRSPSQCKSKFQKFEKEIYTEYLDIPVDHYQVYACIRSRNNLDQKKFNLEKKQVNKMCHREIKVIRPSILAKIQQANKLDEINFMKEEYKNSFYVEGFFGSFKGEKDTKDTMRMREIEANQLQQFRDIQKNRENILKSINEGLIQIDLNDLGN